MTTALQYALFGFVCAMLAWAFTPPWYVIIIAFCAGTVLGLVLGLMCEATSNAVEKLDS